MQSKTRRRDLPLFRYFSFPSVPILFYSFSELLPLLAFGACTYIYFITNQLTVFQVIFNIFFELSYDWIIWIICILHYLIFNHCFLYLYWYFQPFGSLSVRNNLFLFLYFLRKFLDFQPVSFLFLLNLTSATSVQLLFLFRIFHTRQIYPFSSYFILQDFSLLWGFHTFILSLPALQL